MFRFLLLCLLLFSLAACGGISVSSKKTGIDPLYGRYKIGTPYKIKGKLYRPKVNYKYNQVGIASWYGKQFHGRTTANGAIFDMNKVTAAHRTLPLPSYVLVENLENGRKLKILVNDRGPFYDDRIIDLSREAAKKLGVFQKGTARVRVTLLAKESLELLKRLQRKNSRSQIPTTVASAAEVEAERSAWEEDTQDESQRIGAVPTGSLKVENLEPLETQASGTSALESIARESNLSETTNETTEAVRLSQQISEGNQVYIQVGAYGVENNAINVQRKIKDLGTVHLSQTESRPYLHRVRIGPFKQARKALRLLDEAKARGFRKAHIIVSDIN